MQCWYYLLRQKQACEVRCIRNKGYQFFLNILFLTFSFLLLIINPVYGGSTDQKKLPDKTVFVTKKELADQGVGWLAETPMEVLRLLQKWAPNMSVEALHNYSFKAAHEHLGESDNIRKTFFSSIPEFKKIISVYSVQERSPEIAEKDFIAITLNGMIKHLEHQAKAKDPRFEQLLNMLNTPLDTTKWSIYDGGTTDEAINNVAMEVYGTFKRWGNAIKQIISGKNSNDTEINIDTLFRKSLQDLYRMDEELSDSVQKRYIVRLREPNPAPDESDNAETESSYRSSWSNGSLNKAMGILLGALTVGQYINTGAAITIPPALMPGPAAYTGTPSCLAADGRCITVGNANVTRLMTNNPTANFVAGEDLYGDKIVRNSNVTAAVPGEFSGTFSTGVYSLKGFPVNGITPFFESINNSHIECNVPLKSGEIPANAQPLLTRRALHANKVETTLQWPDNPDHAYYTYPVAGNITGDHNKFIVKNSVSRSAEVFYWNYFLEQKDTGIIATEVSGDRNSLDLQGEIHVFKTVDNKVPGNIAKTISGSYNRLIQKGPFVVSSTLNSDKISLTIDRSDTSVESSGLLEVSVPVEGTNSSEWGTVCDEGFSSLSGFVACRQLGFDTGYKDDTEHQCSSRSVLLSNVRCLGNETSLLECPHDVAGEHNCTQPPVELRCTNLKNYNNNTVLYSGLLGRTPEFATNTAVAFWDRAGYVDFNGLLRENSVDTTKPNDWRIAQQHLCASEKCTTSCHYVNEQFHSVINHGNKTLLVTRQHYPIVSFFPLDGLAEQEAKGVIRVTDISKPGANGTIQLYHPPVDNPHLGAQNASDPSVYTPPVSEVVINDTLLSLHRRPAFYDLSGLKFLEPNDEAPGVQLSELSLDGTNSTYNSVTYDFPGEDALLLNENAVFTHNKANHTIIQRSLNSDGQHYTISETNVTYQLPAEPLIATGTDEGYMYVVTKEQVSDNSTGSTNLIFSRYNLSNNERDVSWNRSVQPNDLFDDEGNYKLLFSDDEIQLLRRGELFSLNDVPYALQVPHGGGCSEIRNKQALMASVEATTSQTVLQPTSMVVSQPTSSLSPSPTSSLSPPPTSSSSNKNEKNDVVAIASGVAVAAVSTLGATVIVAALCKKHCENKKRFTVDSIMHENADLPETKGRYTKKEETATKNLENPTEEPKKYKITEV